MNSSTHIFALYVAGRSLPAHPFTKAQHNQCIVRDAALAHRIQRVLRLQAGEALQLFDDHSLVDALFMGILGADGVQIMVQQVRTLQPLRPAVHILLPLLKREALQDAIYTCVEMGANVIELVVTEKTQKKWTGDHELNRLRAIMIAAAEQSKQFVLPKLQAPQLLVALLAQGVNSHEMRLYLDPNGQPLNVMGTLLSARKPKAITLTFGPEGDFTSAEKTLLISAGFQACALTPTILRAQQALAVSLGFVRSVV